MAKQTLLVLGTTLLFGLALSAPTSKEGCFWHLTDMHLDTNYTVSANSEFAGQSYYSKFDFLLTFSQGKQHFLRRREVRLQNLLD